MSNVPDQPVPRCVKHTMQRHCQFHNPKARPEMFASFRHRADRLGAQFLYQQHQVTVRKLLEINGCFNLVK